MLPEVPAVNVAFDGVVSAPLRFSVPAPPDISITLLATVPIDVNVIPPLALNVPEVITMVAILLKLFEPGKVISPETVADPALIFHDIMKLFAVGSFIV